MDDHVDDLRKNAVLIRVVLNRRLGSLYRLLVSIAASRRLPAT